MVHSDGDVKVYRRNKNNNIIDVSDKSASITVSLLKPRYVRLGKSKCRPAITKLSSKYLPHFRDLNIVDSDQRWCSNLQIRIKNKD